MTRWRMIGLLHAMVIAGLVAVVLPPASDAATSLDPCHALTRAQAAALLGERSVLASHLGRSECLYVPVNFSGSAGSSSTYGILITEQTGAKAVQGFHQLGDPHDEGHVEGSLPSGISAQEVRPHPFRVDGDAAYYLGPISGSPTVVFRGLANGVVIVLGVPSEPKTPIDLGKRAMTEVLGHLKN